MNFQTSYLTANTVYFLVGEVETLSNKDTVLENQAENTLDGTCEKRGRPKVNGNVRSERFEIS